MAESKSSEIIKVEGNQKNMWHKPVNKPVFIVVALIAAFVILMAGLVLGRGANFRMNRFGITRVKPGYSTMMSSAGPSTIINGSSTNQDSIQGVVTNVSGSTLTIAGYGATNTVVTNSSTQYIGGSTPLVNDTVVVVGTINSNTFTATQISINP